MKNKIVQMAILVWVGISMNAKSQSCPTLQLKDEMQLIYFTETAPVNMATFTGDYYKKSEKERKKIDEKFERETPWTKDIMVNKVKVYPGKEGYIEIKTTSTRNSQPDASTDYFAYCKNDTLITRPGYLLTNKGTVTEFTYYNKNANGFTLLFEKATPNILNVGQKLLDQQSSFSMTSSAKDIKFPELKEVSREITSYGNYNSRGQWNELYKTTTSKFETTMIDVHIESSVYGHGYLKNRFVKDKKEVNISGKNYTAYLLVEENWTGGIGMEATTDNPFINKHNKKFSEKMAKNTSETLKKTLNANAEGYIVNVIETWYIPGLGAYSMTTYNSYGKKIGYLELKEIR